MDLSSTQKQSKKQKDEQHSHLLIISHGNDDFHILSQALYHYFPPLDTNQQKNILISNKYYQANVKLQNKFWKEIAGFEKISDEENTNNHLRQQQTDQIINYKPNQLKYDIMIMLINETQDDQVNFQSLDQIIEKFNPEEFVLLINTTNPLESWKYQDLILEKCNNFIEIVKEDLTNVLKQKPQWKRGALLQDLDDSDEIGIFSIFDRLETTRWTTLINKNQKKKSSKPQQNKKSQQQLRSPQISIKQTQDPPINQLESSPLIQNTSPITEKMIKQTTVQKSQQDSTINQQKNYSEKPCSSDQQQQTEQKKIQQQMLQFEKMMTQMMTFKAQAVSMKDHERKNKAEELFTKMFKGIIDS